MLIDKKPIPDTPWHPGELELQRRVGVAERMDDIGRRVLRDHLIEQHQKFYPLLPFVAVGSVDDSGNPWATIKVGRPGFLHGLDSHTLRVDANRDFRDPAEAGLKDGDAVAILGIELHTRRRNRLNGTIRRQSADYFDITVGQAYGNCPQYIQLRDFEFVREPQTASLMVPEVLEQLDPEAINMIRNADTFFVASYADVTGVGRQVDVSHRGGNPGFVRIDDEGNLTIPDFAGNLFFNTLGNILTNGLAGLVFIDFSTGTLLQMTGKAEIVLESDEVSAFQGAERLWTFRPQRIIRSPDAVPLRWRMHDDPWSPNVLLTGSWDETQQRLDAKALAKRWRAFRVTEIVEESETIRSFRLAPVDEKGILPHSAGQHLPVRLKLPGDTAPVIRTYTLSTAPSDGFYRISIKRDGRFSGHMHREFRIGDLIEARSPAGAFGIDTNEKRPAVLLAAGIGITPLLSMLRHIVYEGKRTRHTRPVWLFHAAKTKGERAFDAEITELVSAAQGVIRWVRVLSDPSDATAETDFDHAGHIDITLLRETLPFDDYDFYICGPPAFMQSIDNGLVALNIADTRIHAESFGPSALMRLTPNDEQFSPEPPAADGPVEVAFPDSPSPVVWTPEIGTLLECADAAGLSIPSSCRVGSCGSCRSKLESGAVTYIRPVSAAVDDNEVLLCSAVPAQGTEAISISVQNCP